MNRKRFIAALGAGLFVVLLGVGSAGLAATKPKQTWSYHLSQLRRHALKVGIQVTALASGRTLWENGSHLALVPASLTKVLTSYAALKVLGPHYRFKTEIFAAGRIEGGTLHGKLVVRGGGDPYLLAKDAWQIASDLKTTGIDKITGGVYIDNSFFQPEWEHLCIDQHCDRAYNPVLSALALEYNTVEFRVFSGSAVGKPPRIAWFPATDYVTMVNKAKTIGRKKSSRLQIRSRGMQKNRQERFEFAGTFRTDLPLGYDHRINVQDPITFAARTLATMLRQAGIQVGSGTGTARADSKTTWLITHQSMPLGNLLFGLNRYSNNFMAEMLVRVVGATDRGAPATAAKGFKTVTHALHQLGVPNAEVSLDSGSGLSRTTKASARAFNLVLRELYNDFDLAPEFISSLARNGHEGTLRKRMRSGKRRIIVRGKTGTLTRVVGFSGYVSDSSGRVYAVTVLLNDVKQRWEAKRALDNLLIDIPRLAGSKG